jgi:hypothetical protein
MQNQTQPPELRIPCNNTQCTHMTVTRLYTQELCCSTCLRVPPLGWLYRCTQDRELLLEDDLERGIAVSPQLSATSLHTFTDFGSGSNG